jgi:hypothetical protein
LTTLTKSDEVHSRVGNSRLCGLRTTPSVRVQRSTSPCRTWWLCPCCGVAVLIARVRRQMGCRSCSRAMRTLLQRSRAAGASRFSQMRPREWLLHQGAKRTAPRRAPSAPQGAPSAPRRQRALIVPRAALGLSLLQSLTCTQSERHSTSDRQRRADGQTGVSGEADLSCKL